MKHHRRLADLLQYSAARLLFFCLGRLPRRLAIAGGRALARALYRLSGKLRRIGDFNLKMAFPEMDAGERQRLLRASMVNLGRHLSEFSRLSALTPEALRKAIDCEGLENLESARTGGRGVILITAHLGAWEMISFAIAALGYPFDFLVRRIENSAIERAIEESRTRFGNRTIDKRGAARSMLTTLRTGGVLGLAVDINVVRDKGIFVDFFGVPASTTFMAAKLALRTGSPIVPVFAPWDDLRCRFVISFDAPLTIVPSGDEKEDIRQLTSSFTKIIEERVRRHPDQWLWIHKRWRTRAVGEKNFYAALE